MEKVTIEYNSLNSAIQHMVKKIEKLTIQIESNNLDSDPENNPETASDLNSARNHKVKFIYYNFFHCVFI